MISQSNNGLSRDRNLNFRKPTDANNVQIVDNHKGNKAQDDNKTIKESNTSVQKSKEEARKREEYDNYRNTFSDGRPQKIYAQEESSNSSRNLLSRSASIKEKSSKSPDPKRLINSNSVEMELRSAPAKPKSLAPPVQRLGINSQKLKKQGSNDRTPTPTQQAHLKKIKSQTSEEEERIRNETLLQRQILFDELEERIEHFKADAKSENISVQGAEKFEKIVNFNKQLRQFKKVHDRNKLICQESLREDETEEQNFIPELPEPKDTASLYKDFEKPKLVRIKSEQALKEFQEKHKKLAASYIHQREQKAEEKLIKIKNKINSPILTDKIIDKFPTSLNELGVEKKKELVVEDIAPKSLKDMKDMEKEIFKSIEALNIDSDEASLAENRDLHKEEDYESKLKFDKPEDMLKRISSLKYINPLSTSIDETMFESLPITENITKPETTSRKGDIKQLIQQFDIQKENSKDNKKSTERQGTQDFQGSKATGPTTKITNDAILDKIETDVDSKTFSKEKEKITLGGDSPISDEIIALYTQKSMSNISPLEGWSDRTNSMNKEALNFEEELLNYEADSLNPPDKEQKGISYMNSKRIKQISFEENEVENAEKEKSALRTGFLFNSNKNEKVTTEVTVLQKGYRFGSKRIIDDYKENKSNIRIEESETVEGKVSSFTAASDKTDTSGHTKQGTKSWENNSAKAIFQSGFLLNGNANESKSNTSSQLIEGNEKDNSKRRFENDVKNCNAKADAVNEKEKSKVLKDKPLFQSGFLLNSENTNKTKKWDSDTSDSKVDTKSQIEEKILQTSSTTSSFKSRFLLSTALESSETQNLDSSLSGAIKENGKDYMDSDFEKGIHEIDQTKERDIISKTQRKKSVHFESKDVHHESQIKNEEVSPVKSFFPTVDPITSVGSKIKVPETSQYQREGEKKMTNGILTNLNSERNSLRKESLDNVDMELNKLGLHKTSDDIRSQYLSKLHITSPPSKISSLIMKDEHPVPETHYYSSSQPITASVSHQVKTATSSTWLSTTMTDTTCKSVASDECTALLKKEEMITEENARLTSKSEVQKSNFELSKSLNVLRPLVIPTSSQANDAKDNAIRYMQTPTVPTMRPRPPLRPMFMTGGYPRIGPGRMRGMSPIHRPRLNFPYGPPRHLKASPPLRPNAQNNMRTSPPPRHMHFYRSPSPTHGLIRITPRHLPPNFRQRFPGRESPLGMGHRFSPPHKIRQHPPVFSPQRVR